MKDEDQILLEEIVESMYSDNDSFYEMESDWGNIAISDYIYDTKVEEFDEWGKEASIKVKKAIDDYYPWVDNFLEHLNTSGAFSFIQDLVTYIDEIKKYAPSKQAGDDFERYITELQKDSPTSLDNLSKYPLNVSLYQRLPKSRKHKLVKSFKVMDKKNVENAVKYLLNSLNKFNLEGKPKIIVEKNVGHLNSSDEE